MDLATQVLNKAFLIALILSGINSTILPSAMSKKLGQTGFFKPSMKTGLGKWKLWIQTSCKSTEGWALQVYSCSITWFLACYNGIQPWLGHLAYVPGGVSITSIGSHCTGPLGLVNLWLASRITRCNVNYEQLCPARHEFQLVSDLPLP